MVFIVYSTNSYTHTNHGRCFTQAIPFVQPELDQITWQHDNIADVIQREMMMTATQ